MIFGYKDEDIKKIYCPKCKRKHEFRRYRGTWHGSFCDCELTENGETVYHPKPQEIKYIICPRCGYLDYSDGKNNQPQCKACEYPKTIDTGYSSSDLSAFDEKYPPSVVDEFKAKLRKQYTESSDVFHSKAYKLVLELDEKRKQRYYKQNNIIPGHEDEVWYREHNKSDNSNLSYTHHTLHCPKCGSSNVVISQRGYTLMTGFIGSNKTMNRCGDCGYKWEP